MGIRKDIKEIKSRIDCLTTETINKAKKYDELIKDLSKIKLKIKKTSFYVDNYGKVGIKVDYQVPQVFLNFDDNNEVIKDELFYVLNTLNLIPIEDQLKISEEIRKAQNQNNL